MKFRASKTADWAYFGLCFSIFFSLNSLTSKYFGVTQVASPLILIFCLTIFLTAKVRYSSFNFVSVKLLYSVFISYYLIGFMVRLGSSEMIYRVSLFSQISFFITSLIIILAIHQYIYYRIKDKDSEIVIFNGAYIPIIFSLLYALYEYKSGTYIIKGTEGIQGRSLGVFGNPNELGGLANIGLLMTFYSLLSHRKFKFIKVVFVIMCLFVSFLSLSRTSLITSSFIILSLLFINFKNILNVPKQLRYKLGLISSVLIISISYVVKNFEKLLIEFTDQWQAKKIMTIVDLVFKGKITKETTSERSLVVEYGINWIEHSPIFGNGLGFFAHFPLSAGFDFGIHNTYLLILGDSGIGPFLIFLFFIIYMLYKSFFLRNINISYLVFGSFTIWALQCVSGHNGLSDKIFNILITFAVLYFIYGCKVSKVKNILAQKL